MSDNKNRANELAEHAALTTIFKLKDAVKRFDKLKIDPDKTHREKRGQCRVCFYLSQKVAMQAFRERDCEICEKTETYSSSDTDKLCLPCAEKHALCKKCGVLIADVEKEINRLLF